jgi:RNA polymerase sporulation-specific sigma factor
MGTPLQTAYILSGGIGQKVRFIHYTGDCMISITLALMIHSLYLCLRVNARGGAFAPRLTPEEETALWQKFKQGDKRAQDALIERNMRLVTHIARKFYASESDYEDLLSCGTIGLIKAVLTFDPDKGARFATYACRCIENAIPSQRLFLSKTMRITHLFRENGVWFAMSDSAWS